MLGCLWVPRIFPKPRPSSGAKQAKQDPGSCSAPPHRGHMTSVSSELCHLMSRSAAACRVASISGACQPASETRCKNAGVGCDWRIIRLPNANSFIIPKLNSTQLPTSAEALEHRRSLYKSGAVSLAQRSGRGGAAQPLVVAHRSHVCASVELLIAARHPKLTRNANISPVVYTALGFRTAVWEASMTSRLSNRLLCQK